MITAIKEELVLLAGFNKIDGAEVDWENIKEYASELGVATPRVHAFESVDDFLASKDQLPANLEGFIIRFESGFRCKLKGDSYLELHKESAGIGPGPIYEALYKGEEAFSAFLENVPEELEDYVKRVELQIRREADKFAQTAIGYYEQAPKDVERKEFAKWVKSNVPKEYRSAIFQLLDNKIPDWLKISHKNSK